MSKWNKLDIGKVIVYKSKSELRNEEVAIYDVDVIFPNIVKAIGYPIALPSRITNVIGLIKDQEKEREEYLKEAGDWYFKGFVSKDEMGELERIAKTVKTPSHEDLSPLSTFH
jgi:hypothetical protein